MRVHPASDQLLSGAIENHLGPSDHRWRFDRPIPGEAEQRRRAEYISSFADRVFGGLEALWQDFYHLACSWGALAGQYWSLGRDRHMEREWKQIPDNEKIMIETEFMEFLGIANAYPSRRTRKITIFMHVQWWLTHEFSMRILDCCEFRQKVEEATDRRLQIQECGVCGRRYQEIQFNPYWIEPFEPFKGCCLGCPLSSPSPKQLPIRIRRLVDACGFVPPTGTMFEDRSFMKRIEPDRFVPAAKAYARLGGLQPAVDHYGSWMKAVIESGAVGDQAWPTARGIRCIAKDGDVCLSLDERAIDDWLYDNKIPHSREPKYPVHPELNPNGRLRGDWLVGDVVIEYFGLAGEENYDVRVQRKLDLAQAFGFELIPIYYSDMSKLSSIFSHLKTLNRK